VLSWLEEHRYRAVLELGDGRRRARSRAVRDVAAERSAPGLRPSAPGREYSLRHIAEHPDLLGSAGR
jgi:hypothetical protein